MKTSGMSQQIEALRRMDGRDGYGLFMDQGTGKTWCLLADAERLYGAGKIDGILVITLNGVHTNWVLREIPQHLEVPHIARAFPSGNKLKANMRRLEQVFDLREHGKASPMRIATINFESVLTKDGEAFCRRFLRLFRCMLILDESERIKNGASKTNKKIFDLRNMVQYARIATGTPMDVPTDIFYQMEFVKEGCLGTSSYRAFVAEYAHLEDMSSPMMQRMVQKSPRAAYAQLVRRDSRGQKMWRNLSKLRELIQEHAYRVRKEDCLDLPPKIYKTHYFSMSPKQSATYSILKNLCRIMLNETESTTVSRLTAFMKLQQVTSGYVIVPTPGENDTMESKLHYIEDGNNRTKALLELLPTLQGSTIIWARFREELSAIAAELRKQNLTFCEYHGGVSTQDREDAVDGFQEGRYQFFVSNPESGGTGLTLTKAENVIYFSNSFRFRVRAQSEDRAHRIGQDKKVLYIDLIAEGTIDEVIVDALQTKKGNAQLVLGDVQPVDDESEMDLAISNYLMDDN